MFKKIREEKTFVNNMKFDIKEALQDMENKEEEKGEVEELWIQELIQRKRNEIAQACRES